MPTLSNAQREILKLFKAERSDSELLEIKQLLSEFIAKKLVDAVDTEADDRGYTAQTVDAWKEEHFRTSYR